MTNSPNVKMEDDSLMLKWIKLNPIRNIILFAGFIYILGELGFELLSANIISLSKYQTLTQNQIIARYFFELIEESFGLLGILLFNYALLSLLKIKNARFQIKFLWVEQTILNLDNP